MRSPHIFQTFRAGRPTSRAALTAVAGLMTSLFSGCACCDWMSQCCGSWTTRYCGDGVAATCNWIGNWSDRYAASRYNRQGVAMYNQGYYDAAQTHFKEAVTYNPQEADYYYNLAANYHRQRNPGKAEYFYNQCLDNNGNHRKGYHALAVLLLEEQRTDDALALLEGWADDAPYAAEPSIELAWAYRQVGDLEAAQDQLRHALEIAPQHPEALAALGTVYEAQGRTDRAVAMYDRSLRSNGNQPMVSTRLANLRASGGPTASETRVVRTPQPTNRF